MHADMFAVASSFRWQTLTVSANVFPHLENICVKMEREKIAHLQCVVENCGQNAQHALSEGSQVKEVKNQDFSFSCGSVERPT